MGLLDGLKSMIKSELTQQTRHMVNDAVDKAKKEIGKGMNRTEKFTFSKVPTSVEELKAIPEAKLDSAFKAAALTLLVLLNYENDKEGTYKMLDFLKGPEDFGTPEKMFLDERIGTRLYIVKSFFEGATVENDYKPSSLTIKVMENPYSFDTDNWATLYVKSSGADSERPIKLRKKPSTGEWFLNDIQCLADIRIPKSTDKWA